MTQTTTMSLNGSGHAPDSHRDDSPEPSIVERVLRIDARTEATAAEVTRLDTRVSGIERSAKAFQESTTAVLSSISQRVGAGEKTLAQHAQQLTSRGIAIAVGVAVAQLIYQLVAPHLGLPPVPVPPK